MSTRLPSGVSNIQKPWVDLHTIAAEWHYRSLNNGKSLSDEWKQLLLADILKEWNTLSDMFLRQALPVANAAITAWRASKQAKKEYDLRCDHSTRRKYRDEYKHLEVMREADGRPQFQDLLERVKENKTCCKTEHHAFRRLLEMITDAPVSWRTSTLEFARFATANAKKRLNECRQMLTNMENELGMHANAQRARLGVMRDTGVLGSGWFGPYLIGEGGFGKCNAWLKQDPVGNIVDRIVIKDSQSDKRTWNSNHLWVSDLQGKRVPTEIHALEKLSAVPDSEMIVKLRNWRIDSESRLYRLYMEYCPYGDLQLLHTKHTPRTRVPEPFIWHVFESLVKAGLLMERGAIDPNKSPSSWRMIAHRDWKPGNVFLGTNIGYLYCRYPMPKVGDFGLCTFPSQRDNPDAYGTPGTPGAIAPEVVGPLFELRENRKRFLTSKTNVWGVGGTVMGLMDSILPFGPSHRFDSQDLIEPIFREPWSEGYSRPLRQLVKHCLRYNPDDRPTFDSLLLIIQSYTAHGANGSSDYSSGLRRANMEAREWGQYPIAIWPDAFRLGERFAKVPLPPWAMRYGHKRPSFQLPRPPFENKPDELGGPAGNELFVNKRKREMDLDGIDMVKSTRRRDDGHHGRSY